MKEDKLSGFKRICVSSLIILLILNGILFMAEGIAKSLVESLAEDKAEKHYPVESYRYFETDATLLSSGQQRVEVIFKTDSETAKREFSTSDIKIGDKTEVVVVDYQYLYGDFTFYMTKEDYESLFQNDDKKN